MIGSQSLSVIGSVGPVRSGSVVPVVQWSVSVGFGLFVVVGCFGQSRPVSMTIRRCLGSGQIRVGV